MKTSRVFLLVAGIVTLVILLMLGIIHPRAILLQVYDPEAQKERAEVAALLPQLPKGSTHVFDLPYVPGTRPGATSDSVQTLDLFVPPGPGPFPLVIWIHGGGWHSGGKEASGAHLATAFLPHGFALASLDYRLVHDARFPAQIEDCNAALGWLRAHASEYRLDPNHVGVVGHSAGAHLAALMAVTGDGPRFSQGSKDNLRVQAALCWATPADLDVVRGQWPGHPFLVDPQSPSRFFFPDATYQASFAREASPASYVHPGLPPLLIVHGAKDDLVPLGQAQAFAEALQKAGNDVVFRVDPSHGHDVITPLAIREALAFFEENLMPPPATVSPESQAPRSE